MEKEKELKIVYLSDVKIGAEFRYNRCWFKREDVFKISYKNVILPAPSHLQRTFVAINPKDEY